MDAVDDSEHYYKTTDEPPSSLLAIIIDTNPHAWALFAETLSFSQAIANLLVFINAHIAFNQANKVTVIASHIQRAQFLHPTPPKPTTTDQHHEKSDSDTEMAEAPAPTPAGRPTDAANFYRPFSDISTALFASLSALFASTAPASLSSTATTSLAGAITLALTYINRQSVLLNPSLPPTAHMVKAGSAATPLLTSRILVLSISPASPAQYIPLMNTIFASQRLAIPIDILSLQPGTTSSFLQQAADATGGTYLALAHPHGMLQTLMQAFLPTPPSRALLVAPTQLSVDFRAACFCHRRVVDVGYVCSVCLSIFCEPPDGALCLTCGTYLRLGHYGMTPAVALRKKKKKRREGGVVD